MICIDLIVICFIHHAANIEIDAEIVTVFVVSCFTNSFFLIQSHNVVCGMLIIFFINFVLVAPADG